MTQDDALFRLWRPVSSGRHAFPITARTAPRDEIVTAYCGEKVEAEELHREYTKIDWITRETCMKCWHVLAHGPE